VCRELDVELNGVNLGLIKWTPHGWRMETALDQPLVDAIGNTIDARYA
jgi:hypothetical protein